MWEKTIRMDKNLITHVFSSLQSLEKYFESVRKLIRSNGGKPEDLARTLSQYEKALKQMRRSANKLQLEIAQEDWTSAVRSLRVYYGLNQMVRPDIVSALVQLTNNHASLKKQSSVHALYH